MTSGAPESAEVNTFHEAKGISELFGMFGGMVSVCWSNSFKANATRPPRPGEPREPGLGTFDSERAGKLTEDAVKQLGEIMWKATTTVAESIPNGGDRDHFLYCMTHFIKELGRNE